MKAKITVWTSRVRLTRILMKLSIYGTMVAFTNAMIFAFMGQYFMAVVNIMLVLIYGLMLNSFLKYKGEERELKKKLGGIGFENKDTNKTKQSKENKVIVKEI